MVPHGHLCSGPARSLYLSSGAPCASSVADCLSWAHHTLGSRCASSPSVFSSPTSLSSHQSLQSSHSSSSLGSGKVKKGSGRARAILDKSDFDTNSSSSSSSESREKGLGKGKRDEGQWRGGLGGNGPLGEGIVGEGERGGVVGIGRARTALERLFVQAQRHEERSRGRGFLEENEVEEEVERLEEDIAETLGAMRAKEAELRAAEEQLRAEQMAVQKTRASLVKREKRLEASRVVQGEKKEEVEAMRRKMREQGIEIVAVKKVLAEREEEVEGLKVKLKEKELVLREAEGRIERTKGSVEEVERELKEREEELEAVVAEAEYQRKKVEELQRRVEEQEEEVEQAREEVERKRMTMMKMESDIKARAAAVLEAEEEVSILQGEVNRMGQAGTVAGEELKRTKVLLRQVEGELEDSRRALASFHTELEEWQMEAKLKDSELKEMHALLKARDAILANANEEAEKERKELEQLRLGLGLLECELEGEKAMAAALRVEVEEVKSNATEASRKIGMLQKEMRQRDTALSDAELAVKLGEAEMLSARLELQAMKSDYSAVRAELEEKSFEAEALARTMASLERELAKVRGEVREREACLGEVKSLLTAREAQLVEVKKDLAGSRIKLSEAEGAMEQIATLSEMLAASAAMTWNGDEIESLVSVSERSVLEETNCELFAANRALLERELELQQFQERDSGSSLSVQLLRAELDAVKEVLQGREVELELTRVSLAQKDEELRRLLGRWQLREGELKQMRLEVVDGAKEIEALRSYVRANGPSPALSSSTATLKDEDAAAVTALELEVAKVEVQTALTALQSLADLSAGLKHDTLLDMASASSVQINGAFPLVEEKSIATKAMASSSTDGSPSAKAVVAGGREKDEAEGATHLNYLRRRVSEKDNAIRLATRAMARLTTLTRKLVRDSCPEDVRDRPLPSTT